MEGWDETTNVFDPDVICNNPDEPWSANNSVPKLLFRDKALFEKNFPCFRLKYYEVTECLLFILSGGVNFDCGWHFPIGDKGCDRLIKIDKWLVSMWPEMFAMGLRTVLEKR